MFSDDWTSNSRLAFGLASRAVVLPMCAFPESSNCFYFVDRIIIFAIYVRSTRREAWLYKHGLHASFLFLNLLLHTLTRDKGDKSVNVIHGAEHKVSGLPTDHIVSFNS